MAQRRLVEIVLDGKDKTKGAFDSLGLNLSAGEMKFAKFAAGAAAVTTAVAAATKQLYDFTAQMAATGDRADKLSARLNVTVEALSEIEFVAKRAGVPVNTMTMALQRMVRRVAEAGQGTGEAKDAIRELGIEAGRLSQRSPDEQFYEIARALQDVENQSDRVRLAFKLFDSEGVSVLQAMRGDLEEVRKEFEQFGGAMSSEFSAKSAEFADAQANLATATDRLKEALAEPFLEPFTAAVNKLAETIAGASEAAEKVLQGVEEPGPGGSPGEIYAGGSDLTAEIMGRVRGFRRGPQPPSGPSLNPLTAPPSWDLTGSVLPPLVQIRREQQAMGLVEVGQPSGDLMQGWQTRPGPFDLSWPRNTGAAPGVRDEWFVGLDDFSASMNDLMAGFDDATSAASAFSGNFQTAIGNALNNGLMEAENFGEAFTTLMRAVFQQVIAQSSLNPIVGGFFGGILGLAGGVMGKSYVASAETKGMPGPLALAGAGATHSAAQAAYGKVYV